MISFNFYISWYSWFLMWNMHTQNFSAVWVATKILFRDRFKVLFWLINQKLGIISIIPVRDVGISIHETDILSKSYDHRIIVSFLVRKFRYYVILRCLCVYMGRNVFILKLVEFSLYRASWLLPNSIFILSNTLFIEEGWAFIVTWGKDNVVSKLLFVVEDWTACCRPATLPAHADTGIENNHPKAYR